MVYQDDHWEPSEIETQFMTRYTWMKDHAHAMTFLIDSVPKAIWQENMGNFGGMLRFLRNKVVNINNYIITTRTSCQSRRIPNKNLQKQP